MADHLKPTITSTYSNFVTELDARFDDLAVGLDPAVTTATNVFTNSIRWSSASNKWQKYNGTAWNDLSTLYSIDISGNASTVSNGVYTTGAYANPAWITSLSGSKVTGDIAGNAGTATILATARNINGVAFNGSAAISVNLNTSVTFNNAGTGSASGITFNGGTARTISYNTIGAPSITGTNATGSWNINAATVTNGVYTTGSYADPAWITSLAGTKITGNISGNAATATNATYATTAGNGGVTSVNGLTGAVSVASVSGGSVFTSSGTFTVPTNVSSVKVIVIGGGGNGGAAVQGTGGNNAAGGGGAGGTAIKYITGLTPGANITVTVGAAAGTSSFGAYCSATGGATAATASAGNTVTAGGAGGSASGGNINLTGGSGSAGQIDGTGYATISGSGGGTNSSALNITIPGIPGVGMFGSGGLGFVGAGNGVAGTGYGNGGSGGVVNTGSQTGGAGTGGIVIVEW